MIDNAIEEALIGLEERDRTDRPCHDFGEVGRLRYVDNQAEEP
jgi:hypothetical protein